MLVRRQKKKRGLITSSTLPEVLGITIATLTSKSPRRTTWASTFTLVALHLIPQLSGKQESKANASYLYVFFLLSQPIGNSILRVIHYFTFLSVEPSYGYMHPTRCLFHFCRRWSSVLLRLHRLQSAWRCRLWLALHRFYLSPWKQWSSGSYTYGAQVVPRWMARAQVHQGMCHSHFLKDLYFFFKSLAKRWNSARYLNFTFIILLCLTH